MAALIGAPLSVVTGGVGSMLAAAVALIKAKALLDYQGIPGEGSEPEK